MQNTMVRITFYIIIEKNIALEFPDWKCVQVKYCTISQENEW